MIKEKIRQTTENGDLAVILYTIFGYPDRRTSQKALMMLQQFDITVFETAIPVAQCSKELSDAIRNAHWEACRNGVWSEEVLEVYSNLRPNLYIVHEGTPLHSPEVLLEKMEGRVDAILLGWREKNVEKWHRIAQGYGIEMAQSVSPNMSRGEIKDVVRYAEGFIYLTAAPKTGGKVHAVNRILNTIQTIKEIREDIPICCGFGIKTPENVKRIGSLDGCDGVIIGTAILEALSKGLGEFERYVDGIVAAARGVKRRRK